MLGRERGGCDPCPERAPAPVDQVQGMTGALDHLTGRHHGRSRCGTDRWPDKDAALSHRFEALPQRLQRARCGRSGPPRATGEPGICDRTLRRERLPDHAGGQPRPVTRGQAPIPQAEGALKDHDLLGLVIVTSEGPAEADWELDHKCPRAGPEVLIQEHASSSGCRVRHSDLGTVMSEEVDERTPSPGHASRPFREAPAARSDLVVSLPRARRQSSLPAKVGSFP